MQRRRAARLRSRSISPTSTGARPARARSQRRPGAPLSGRHRRGARAPRRLSRSRPRRLCRGPQRARRFRCSQLSPYLHFGQISPVEIALRCARPGRARPRPRLLPRGADRPPRAVDEFRRTQRALRPLRLPAGLGPGHAARPSGRPARAPYRQGSSSPPAPTTPTGTRRWPRWSAPATCTTTCACTGRRRSSSGRRAGGRVRDHLPPQQQVLPRRARRQFIRQRRLGFGLHDRPWPERAVFGKVRYMNARGLERKFDMAAYLRAVDDLVQAERR